ncbi:MAG: OmpA family protein [Alphaproteobacteria bacterium]
MRFSFQSFIINILAIFLLVILVGITFVIGDRLVLDGQYTGAYSKTERIRELVGQINDERMTIFNLKKENDALKDSLASSRNALNQTRSQMQDTLVNIPSYQLAQFLQKAIPGQWGLIFRNGRVVYGRDIRFSENSANLPNEAASMLNQMASQLRHLEQTMPAVPWAFQVGGHASPQRSMTGPGFGSNWEMAYKRAFGVVQYLIAQGVSPERLSIASFSQYEPDAGSRNDNRVSFRFDYR